MIKKVYLLFLLSIFVQPVSLFSEQEEFIDSFMKYYAFTTVGRYTHEYHPFLFKKSSYSLDELEKTVSDSGISIKGRIVIAGYDGFL